MEKEGTDLDSAMFYLTNSLEMKNTLKDFRGSLTTLLNLSELAQAQKRIQLSESYLNKALELSDGLQQPELLISLYSQLLDFNLEFGSKASAVQYSLKAMDLAEKLNSNFQLSRAAEFAAKSHEAIGDYRSALDFSKIKMKADRILNDENKHKIQKDLLIQYETEKKDIENQRLIEEQRFMDLSLRRKNELLLGSGIILFGLIGLGVFQRKKNKELALAKENLNKTLNQLTNKNEEIQRKSLLLSQANKELKESNAIRERLLSVVSHDVKTPLNSLQLLLDYWGDTMLSQKELTDLIPKIAKQTKTVQNLLKNLLEWAQTQMEYSKLQFSRVNLNELVEDTLLFASSSAEEKKLKILNSIPKGVIIETDKDRLNFIIRNLISNSLKFTKAEGCVEIAYESTGNGKIHVKDNGIGMCKAKLQSLFSKSMGPSIGTDGESGSGVGLLLCKEFAESLGASLDVSSEENVGSTFTISLG